MPAEDLVLGLGNSVDYEILWDDGTFCALAEQYRVMAHELDTAVKIGNERDLVVSILRFMRQGAGGECFVASPKIIRQYAARFQMRRTLGGTSARAAVAASKLGVPATLHLVNMNKEVRRLLPKGCRYLCSAEEENIYPHLIIQYPKCRIPVNDLDFVVKESNRIIYVNDPDNSNLALSGELSGALAKAKVSLFSGFNAMRDPVILRQRLKALTSTLGSLPARGKVYFEDACYHDPSFARIVDEALIPWLDVFGMNEDEFAGYAGRSIDLLDADDVAKALQKVQEILTVPYLVVHTRYWALAYGEDAAALAPALQGGTVMAATRFRLGDDFTETDYGDTCGMPRKKEGVWFKQEIGRLLTTEVWCEPSVNVSVSNPTTIGLGDAFVGGFLLEYLSCLSCT